MVQFSAGKNEVVIQSVESPSLSRDIHKVSDRNFGLDLLRALAIILVLVCHGEYIYYDHLPGLIGNNLMLTGHWGVQLFFVLSGFLIGSIFIKEINTKGFRRKVVFNFWRRRWFRTVPNYFLFLIIYIILAVCTPAAYLAKTTWGENIVLVNSWKLIYFPFFLQNFRTTDIGFFGHSWSLAVEEWFYLTLPVTFWLVTGIHRKNRKGTGNRFAFTIVAMILAFVVLRLAGIAGVFSNYHKLSVIYNLDNLMFGVGLAWLMTNYKAKILARKNRLMALGIFLFLAGWALQNKFLLTGNPQPFWDGIIIPVQTFAFALLLPWFYTLKLKKRTWWSRLITEISLASYSMYLVHFIVLVYVIDRITLQYDMSSAAGSICMFLLFVGVTLAVSSLNYRLFEKRMTSLRDKFPGKRIS